eukprot:gene6111-2715_t
MSGCGSVASGSHRSLGVAATLVTWWDYNQQLPRWHKRESRERGTRPAARARSGFGPLLRPSASAEPRVPRQSSIPDLNPLFSPASTPPLLAACSDALRSGLDQDVAMRAQAAPLFREDDEDSKVETVSRVEEGDDGSSHAQKIVRELYFRFEKQQQRWKDYRSLFFFLFFVGWFLAVLYLQRQSAVAYQVHSTLDSVLVPEESSAQSADQEISALSTDQVYAWLSNTLESVWVDPVCGDGICNQPWEFASYSSFGCRADCGKLQEVQSLTKIQLDLYWDYNHRVGSLPASTLMQQASWNLCPLKTAYSGNCYFSDNTGTSTDKTFSQLSGTYTQAFLDVPDGDWNLVLKRDIFNKVQGAVRDTVKLAAVSYYYKIYIAARSAMAQQTLEISLLNQAERLGNMPLFKYINETLQAADPDDTATSFKLQQLIIATCACDMQLINATCACDTVNSKISDSNATFGASVYGALNNSADYFLPPSLVSLPNPTAYKAIYCANLVPGGGEHTTDPIRQTVVVNRTGAGTIFVGSVPIADEGNYTTINITQLSTNATFTCQNLLDDMLWWRNNHTLTVQKLMIDQRLGDGRTTGRISAMNTVYNALRNYIISTQPELFTPTFVSPLGTLPTQDPVGARIDYLQTLYTTGLTYSTQPAPAYLNITRKTVYDLAVTLPALAERAVARINETLFQQLEMNTSLPVPPPGTGYPTFSVQDVLDLFVAANASQAVLPLSTSSLLGAIATTYNLVSWGGNTTAYMLCDLVDRAPEYIGQCVNMNVTCATTTDDARPYNCSTLDGTLVAGTLASSTYRSQCEMPCDRLVDCNAICTCFGTCGVNQVCMCETCQDISYDATADSSFLDIRSVAQSAGSTSTSIASMSTGRRSLLQTADLSSQLTNVLTETTDLSSQLTNVPTKTTDLSSQLTNVLSEVGSVKSQQDGIASQMSTLQTTVDRANQLAIARANDNTLINLISAGRQDIQTGQAAIESKLDVIIGKQNQSLALAQSASNALAAIQGLAQMQLAAQQALAQAVQNQLTAIKTATYQNIITLTQALALWKVARRNEALTIKAAKLANKPCNSLPSQPATTA